MADVITNKTTLKVENLFADGDSYTILLDGANDSLDSEQVAALETYMSQNQVILSDNGAAFTGLKVTAVSETKTNLDLS